MVTLSEMHMHLPCAELWDIPQGSSTTLVSLQSVVEVDSDDFNDAIGRTNSKTDYAVVANPSDTDLLEVYIDYDGLPNTTFKLGRQVITYRSAPFHRFMGTVLWQQNWQNHDALTIKNTSLPDITIQYAYSWNINRIFGDKAIGARANFDSNSHFISARYTGLAVGQLQVYGYLLDFYNAQAISTQTFGARFNSKYSVNDATKIIYALEYAHQSDYADNPNNIKTNYFMGEAGIAWKFDPANIIKSLVLKFNYELLESNGGTNHFITPLATAHAYQGWADRFLNTPGDGIEDFYFTGVVKAPGVKVILSYHNINSDRLSYDYGEEIDLVISKKFKKYYTLGLKYARYNADRNLSNVTQNGSNAGVTNDTEKFWFFVQFKY